MVFSRSVKSPFEVRKRIFVTCECCKERFVEPLTWVYSLAVDILVEMVRR